MINVFFIADLHFGHKNIIGFCRPQFQDVFEMADKLITNWNKVVKPKDVVYVLGDIAFGKDNLHYLAQMNGRKHLVMGNHDVYAISEYTAYFDLIWGCNNYKGSILTHVPIIESQFYRWKLNIHGHVHIADDDEKLRDDPRYFYVCADSIGLTHISWEEIKERTNFDFLTRRLDL